MFSETVRTVNMLKSSNVQVTLFVYGQLPNIRRLFMTMDH